MSKAQLAFNGYSQNGENVKDLRAQEYDVIIGVTRDLKRVQNNESATFNDVVKVVHKNERLWVAIAAQVADEANALPTNLRASLFSIAGFVSHHSTEVLKKKSDLNVLVDLNVSVLRGLRGAS